MAVSPAHSTDDYWQKAITLFTGYPVPLRESLFDTLVGNDSIPLMQVEISDMVSTPEEDLDNITNNLFWRSNNSGTVISDKNIVIPFYAPKDGSRNAPPGTELKLRQAAIRLLGYSYPTGPPPGDEGFAGEWTDGKTKWSDLPLRQYTVGTGRALETLIWGRDTVGYENYGLHVPVVNAIDYNSFDRAADAFTRAAIFFDNQSKILQSWENRLGEESAAWKGQAAGVFWHLIHRLNKLYDSYQQEMPRIGSAGSKHGEALKHARERFVDSVVNLQERWSTWLLYTGNPLRWLHDILLEVTEQIWDRNIKAAGIHVVRTFHNSFETSSWGGGSQGNNASYDPADHGDNRYLETKMTVESANFSLADDRFGFYDDMTTWKKIGEEAINRWQNCVISELGGPAKDAIIEVRKAFSIPFEPLSATANGNLSADLQDDMAEKEREEQDRKEKEAEEKQAEYEKRQEELQKQQDEKQAELEKRQEEKQAEQEKRQEELQKQQDEKQAELEKRQEEKQAEQEK
ncbi:AAWKG family protein, partial [Streptomyces sp. NPDC048279]|uniref:AAWKG family protein n=1 Tax=Streptomyces sp. NPDC048279 TaxID=3154714 RepID=UPI00342F5E58